MEKPNKISFMYEVSGRCNQSCIFCYNSWKARNATSRKQLDTRRSLNLLSKLIDETGGCNISLSGGEPMLREDIFKIISFIKKKNAKVTLISNGTLLDRNLVDKCITNGVDAFQITLLGDKAPLHNRLAGINGFEKAIDAFLHIKNQKGIVYAFFVGLAENIHAFERSVELCVLLGVPHVAFGRFTPGGSGLKDWKNHIPGPEMVRAALKGVDRLCGKYRISVSISTPLLPCLIDCSEFRNIRFGFCGVGNADHSLFGIDPEGNLKACSHSPYILGNLLEESFGRLIEHEFLTDFTRTLPEFCMDCPEAEFCRGGCRSSAHVCFGSFEEEDPYLKLWKDCARKPKESSFKDEGGASVEIC